MDIRNKKIIVTGGANGIGRTLVERLASEGGIIGVLDIDANSLLNFNNENIITKCCDLTDIIDVEDSINYLFDKLGEINILVNNAGILYSEPLATFGMDGIKTHNVEMWHKVISVNLDAVFYVTKTVVEKMIRKRTKGLLINISSISANGNPGQSAYSASKAAVNALTATWSKELSLMGIRVAAVAPGFFNSPSTHKALSESLIKETLKRVPLKRLGELEEVIEAILFIIKNDFYNGKVLEIDGGLVI